MSGAVRIASRQPYAVLIGGLAITATTAIAVHSVIEARNDARFESAVRATEDRIVARLDTYVALLVATRAMLVASGIDTPRFHAFAEGLQLGERYRGIQGIGFTRRFPWSARSEVEVEVRAQGNPSFRVWPAHERQEGHAIVLLEPHDRRNLAALGYDMFTEPRRRAAMERARDTGQPAASARVTLVQEIDEHRQAGFLIYLPVYRTDHPAPTTTEARRDALIGFVYSPFRADDLFTGVFGTERNPRVSFEVEDGEGGLLHRASAPADGHAHTVTRELEIAGRAWRLRLWSLPAFERASSSWTPALLGGGGLLVSVLLFLLARARARAEAEHRLHSLILHNMREGVSVTDERGIILYTNAAEDEIFGYERGELVGKPVTVQNIYPPEENDRVVHEVIAHLKEHGAWTGEFSNIKKDGTHFTTAARITALALGDAPMWVCVQEDVTDRKRHERERAALLEREQASRIAAEEASRAKDDFLAMLGHELRNPLAPIVTALELMRRRRDVDSPEHAVIERQVRHLQRMVDDLLDLSSIARGKLVLRRGYHALQDIVRQAVELAAPLLEARRHRLEVDVPTDAVVIDGDETRLVQVFANLLTNAAKYTDEGGHVVIRAVLEGGRTRVSVRDDGIGIEPAELERVFELFAQAERRVELSRGGLGIGLSLARTLVELHGGTVTASSAGRGTGTEIIVELPVAERRQEPRPDERPTSAPAHTGRRVLLVDDNADAADLLAELLRIGGHEVEVAYDAPQALAIAARWPPDVAILDIGLPVMDGYELAAQIPPPRPVLIALTGYGRDHDRARSTAAGFDHHLTKPVTPARLLAILDVA